MNVVSSRRLPYRLPLVRPWASAAGGCGERSGWLLRLETDDGRVGWGDCAPFPEIGIDAAAAERYAEECARLDLAAQAAGLPLAVWLAGRPAATAIAVNVALGDLARVSEGTLAAAVGAGFTVLKIKVGFADPADEAARLREVASGLRTGARLRLDANGAWDEAAAAAFLAACADLPVEACEEPLASPDTAALARLQALVPFPLAIDESFHLVDAAFFAAPPVRRLVLKPPRHGLLASRELARRAAAAGMDCVLTSSLESACGALVCAHLAAAVAPQGVHGLATGEWFAADTGPLPPIAAGRLPLPNLPGTGFVPAIS